MTDGYFTKEPADRRESIAWEEFPRPVSGLERAEPVGAAWTGLFIGIIAGLSAALVVILVGGELLTALIWYILVGGLCFALSLALLYWLVLDVDDNQAAASLNIARKTNEPEGTDDDWANQVSWVQRNPLVCSNSDERIFCVSGVGDFSVGRRLADLVVQGGFSVDLCNCLETAISTLTVDRQQWLALFIDIDECELRDDLVKIVSDLMDFRRSVPEVPVIICSSTFARDDFGVERLCIADISLRKPMSAQKVAEGIAIANDNNKEWRIRLNKLGSNKNGLLGTV